MDRSGRQVAERQVRVQGSVRVSLRSISGPASGMAGVVGMGKVGPVVVDAGPSRPC